MRDVVVLGSTGSIGVQVIDGDNSSVEIAALPCDIVLNGITGSIGLGPTLSALGVGNKVALANKESLVAGGELVMKYGVDRIIPVDSEHSAIYQALLAWRFFNWIKYKFLLMNFTQPICLSSYLPPY